MRCNEMEWNGMKSLAPWTIKLSRTTQLSVWTGEETTRLTSSSPFSRRISGMLCSMCRPERNWLPLEKCARKCRKSKSKRPRNLPPFPIVPFLFLPMKEHWRLIQTNFNETFHNFVSWVDLNILLSFWYFFIWRKKIAFSTKMHFSCLNIFKS